MIAVLTTNQQFFRSLSPSRRSAVPPLSSERGLHQYFSFQKNCVYEHILPQGTMPFIVPNIMSLFLQIHRKLELFVLSLRQKSQIFATSLIRWRLAEINLYPKDEILFLYRLFTPPQHMSTHLPHQIEPLANNSAFKGAKTKSITNRLIVYRFMIIRQSK